MHGTHSIRDIFLSIAKNAITVAPLLALAALAYCGGKPSTGTPPPPTLNSITVTPPNPQIPAGATEQFQATGNYSDGTTKNLTGSVTWNVSPSGPATIESSGQASPGLATGVANGSAMINAISGNVTGTTGLTVTNATLTSIFLSPSSTTITVGSSTQFTANGTFSDGTTQNITATASWSSSNTSIATVETTGQANPGDASGVAAGSATLTATSQGVSQSAAVTVSSSTNTTAIPLMDMTNSSQNYLSFAGGLYENSSDTVPTDHDAAGQTIAAKIQPLDANGNPSASGKVVLTSIGMSNAADEFGQFRLTAQSSPSVNQTTLVIANGAKGGITACYWEAAEGPPPCSLHTENQFDRVRDDVLTPLGVTEQQVQAVWIKEVNGGPGVSGCGNGGSLPCNSLCDPSIAGCSNTVTTTEAIRLEGQLGVILRDAKIRWPNLQVAFLTSRIYAGYATVDLSPEPYAYEYGFSVKWFVEAQVLQARNGTVDPVAGDLNYSDGTAPWIAWGPYIWAAGDTPRSDGLIWCDGQTTAPCNGEVDYQSDGTHPNSLGQAKVAYGENTPNSVMNLLDFFLQSPYTKAWFAAAP